MRSYYNNCVNWDSEDVCTLGGLSDMVDNQIEVTRKTFLKNVDKESYKMIEQSLGYPTGKLTMAKDWAVRYYKGKLHGKTAYWINHSAIEYVFV